MWLAEDSNYYPDSAYVVFNGVGMVADENGSLRLALLHVADAPPVDPSVPVGSPPGGPIYGGSSDGPYAGKQIASYQWLLSQPDCSGDNCGAQGWYLVYDPAYLAWHGDFNTGGFSFSLGNLVRSLTPVVVGSLLGGGDITVSQAVGNVATGRDVTENLANAAGVDLAGAAIVGASIAAPVFADLGSVAPDLSASTAADLPAVDLSASAAPQIGGVDLTAASSSSVISPVSSAAIDAGATAPAGSSLSAILAGGKAAIGAVSTVAGLERVINPPKPPAVPAPRPPVVAPAPCSTCQQARPAAGVLAALLPLVWFAFS
jgi:hypothetical protein